jgi:hypothetical protein
MASSAERKRNNVKAGIFVLVALVLALITIIALSGSVQALFKPRDHFIASFKVSAGIKTLSKGSAVKVGGLAMGTVTKVEPDVKGEEELKRINVEFALDRRVRLYEGVVIDVNASLIGGDAWLDITDVGAGKRQLKPGSVIQVKGGGGGLLSMVLGSQAPEMIDNADATLANARKFTASLNTRLDEYNADIAPTLENAREFVTNLNQVRWPEWADRIDYIMTWAENKTHDLTTIIDDGKVVMNDARQIVQENRPRIDASIVNIQDGTVQFKELATRANQETIEKVDQLLNRGKEAMDNASAMIKQLRQNFTEWSVNIDETLGNTVLASQQLKLTMAEIRRSPWKVLYRPSADELDHELLYEAARSFAMAAADLKVSSETVDRMLTEYTDQLDQPVLERIQDNLLNSMGNYERAQQQLFDVLLVDDKP